MKTFTTLLFTLSTLLLPHFISAHAIPELRVLQARDSPTGRCGPQGNGARCDSSGDVHVCCSEGGWCGDSATHCGAGCQADFGKCGIAATPSSNYYNGARPRLGNVPYGVEIFSCTVPNTFAITYDDGPSRYTSDLLDILSRADAKATFFITGSNNAKSGTPISSSPGNPWAPILRRMISEGHQIGGHTWSHLNLALITEAERREQMTRLEEELVGIVGKYPTYMRPPFIATSPAMLATMGELGYHVVIWDLDTADYVNLDAETIEKSKGLVDKALARTEKESWNSIQHDLHFQTVYNLTVYQIERAKEKGFRLVTIGECMGDPEANWYRS